MHGQQLAAQVTRMYRTFKECLSATEAKRKDRLVSDEECGEKKARYEKLEGVVLNVVEAEISEMQSSIDGAAKKASNHVAESTKPNEQHLQSKALITNQLKMAS